MLTTSQRYEVHFYSDAYRQWLVDTHHDTEAQATEHAERLSREMPLNEIRVAEFAHTISFKTISRRKAE